MAHIEQKLLPLLEKIAIKQGLINSNIEVEPISTGGANFSSVLYKAKIQDNDSILNLFIKVGSIADAIRENRDIKIFEAESYAYTTMKNVFKQLEDKYNIPEKGRLVLPVYYGGTTKVGEEVLVLEDLTAKGFSTYDRLKSMDWEYAAAAITELGKFHALSMAFKQEYPHEYKTVTQLTSNWIDDESFDIFWKSGFDKAIEAVRDENKEKLKAFLDKVTAESARKMYNPVKKEVLTHGDYRVSNLMHRYRENGSVQLIPVDYQTLQASCVIMDLLYFIFSGTDEEFCRQYFDQLVEHYYSELRAAMTSLGLTDEEYSRKDFEYELKEKFPSGLVMISYVLPLLMVQSDDAPKVAADMELSSFKNIKTNDIYNKRINGIVDEYDGSVEVIPVDYQTVQGGSLIMDLFLLVFTGSDHQFRKDHFKDLMELYYSELSAAMTRLGLTAKDYSREDFDFELKEKLSYGLLLSAFALPMVTVDSADAPTADLGWETSSFADVKTSAIYPLRMNEVIEDYVRWGILK